MTHLLAGYKVDIIPEYELYKDPMRIDVVVIKLLEDVVIDNTVMRFFKKHNIVEFKSHKDTLGIKAFDRVLSYFYAYLSQQQQSIRFDEAAITFVSVKRPGKLLRILQDERGYKIIASGVDGIYYITADGPSSTRVPAMQLVVSSELSAEDAELIKAIRNDWTLEYRDRLLESAENSDDDLFKETIFSLCSANEHALEEDKGMNLTAQERRFLHKWAAKAGVAEELKQEGWQEGRLEGWQEGIEEERRKNAKAMKNEGIDVNTIAKITGLKAAAIRRL
jgi:predicted transposase/invertase (TIGR01784 family)